jgi:hypothetical protein
MNARDLPMCFLENDSCQNSGPKVAIEQTPMKQNRILGLVVAVLALPQINAFALDYGMTGEFSNGTAPSGTTPWASVGITDDGKGVLVTLSIGQNDIGKLSEWYLNYDPTRSVSQLQINGIDTADVKSWSADTGINAFKADGDGTYDIRFNFATSGNTFKTGESLQFRITSKDGTDLNPEDFDYVSVGGAKGSFHTAAHVQALTGGYSGWVGDVPGSPPVNEVPDGSLTVTLLGMGIVTIEFLRRKVRKNESES